MNWHETIEFIRTKPEYKDLVRDAYFDPDLENNIKRFGKGKEFEETLKLIKTYAPNAQKILDIGAGNGISTINLALEGYHVTAIEPDTSDTVGANAIRELIDKYQLNNVTVYEKFAEEINFPDESFDLVYVRQAMHHAYNLQNFITEAARVLKKGGILLTIRDHVVFNEQDKKAFLEIHPLHRFYNGENAFHPQEYKEVFKKAGLQIVQELKYFESEINYFPQTKNDIIALRRQMLENLQIALQKKLGLLAKLPFVFSIYKMKNRVNANSDEYFERMLPGRMYSYVLRK